MKKYVTLSIVGLLFSYSESFGQCQYSSGSPIYTKQATYYCHQYVKAALLQNWVDLATGFPTHAESDFVNFTGDIHTDQNFIRVCSINDARVVLPCPGGDCSYHSALKMNNGIFASTPNGSTASIYSHQSATAFTTACPADIQYYAAIPNIIISGSSGVNQGMNVTFTLTNNSQAFPSFITLNASKWTYNSTYFTFVSSTSTSITLTAKNVAGSSDVKYELNTGCGINYEIKTVQVVANCTGTLNGGQLNTFNSVPGGPNQVVMVQPSWTWVRTSGTATWSTANSGKNMTFSLSSGCSTFNAYNSSCNLTIIFCKSSSLVAYSVVDMETLQVIKQGSVENTEASSTLLEGLPAGMYVVKVDGKSTRYSKSD
ncbi:MAG: hypothetical protein WDO14_09785 [Bacteroidota bacterium]